MLNTSGITGLGARATLTLDTSVATVNVDYFVDHPVWSGALERTMEHSHGVGVKNWVLASNSATTTDFITGDTVVFDDTATGTTTVTINGADVTPGSVQFNNSAKNYTLTGDERYHRAANNTRPHGQTVTINNANTYTGGTTISAGTLVTGNANALGTGAVALNGGTLNVGGQTLANAVTLGGGKLAGGGMLSGVLSGGVLNEHSAGNTLALTGANTYTGGTTITAGTLQIGGSGQLGTGSYVSAIKNSHSNTSSARTRPSPASSPAPPLTVKDTVPNPDR